MEQSLAMLAGLFLEEFLSVSTLLGVNFNPPVQLMKPFKSSVLDADFKSVSGNPIPFFLNMNPTFLTIKSFEINNKHIQFQSRHETRPGAQ